MVAIQDLYNQHKTSEEEKENQSINVQTAYEGDDENFYENFYDELEDPHGYDDEVEDPHSFFSGFNKKSVNTL